jgi:hypothetical protein
MPAKLLIKQSSQEAFPGWGELVKGHAVEGLALNQASIPEDAEVPTDPALLTFNNQAEVANTSFLGFSQQMQQDQTGRVAQRLSLPRQSQCLLVVEALRLQPLRFSGLRKAQTSRFISHAQTD